MVCYLVLHLTHTVLPGMPRLPHFDQPLDVVLYFGGGLLDVLLFVVAVLGHQIGIRQVLMCVMHPSYGDFSP